MKSEEIIAVLTTLFLVLTLSVVAGCVEDVDVIKPIKDLTQPSKIGEFKRFESGEQLLKAFEDAREISYSRNRWSFGGVFKSTASAVPMAAESADAEMSLNFLQADDSVDFSDTNIQVQGVDEADIIKTDGKYIYLIAKGKLIIVKAYPAGTSEILSMTKLDNFRPNELFIQDGRLLLFGSATYDFSSKLGELVKEKLSRRGYVGAMSVRLYDVSDKEEPELIRTVDFEGGYVTSRKIGSDVYFVINSYPYFYSEHPVCEDIVPLYRDSEEGMASMMPIAECTDIGYVEPVHANNFITVASISMTDENSEIKKEIIVGNGQNVYASRENLYIAQTTQPDYNSVGMPAEEHGERTVVTSFALDKGNIEYKATGSVKGHILNQFSMDEHDSHFRIATTIGEVWDTDRLSTNNVYVLDENLKVVGELEDLAPGEKIYSVRFMGKKAYVVTFKKVDPLFVIDLSKHDNPTVLGKLKIPGYSDYLHPYDENHIIGIGKDTVEAGEDLVERRGMDFAWYQGIKMAVFDVSDVENPIELHKVIIGDRGTESEALHNHKAFLFDRKKNLLVIPITLAKIQGEKSRDNQHGEFIYQGAYVFDLTLKNGFKLKGKVTHYDDDQVFKKSGYYFSGESGIKRSLYIEDVLYTLSNTRLQLNDLDSLARIKALNFDGSEYIEHPEIIY